MAYAAEVRSEYAKIADTHARAQADKRRLTLKQARDNGLKIDWSKSQPKKPSFLGTRSFDDYSLKELTEYIDWTPFFQTWELSGRYPQILNDEKDRPPSRPPGTGSAPARCPYPSAE